LTVPDFLLRYSMVVFFLFGFPFGKEELFYNLYLGPFRVGELKLSLRDSSWTYQNVYFLSAVLKAKSPFRIYDSLFSISRKDDFTTLYSYKKVEEGGERKEISYHFREGRIEYSDGTVFSSVPPPKDLLSLWYYFRLFLPETASATFAHFDKRNYLVWIIPKESVKISLGMKFDLGEFRARRISPRTSPKSILGDVYISEDSLRLPLVIKTKLLLGLVRAVLKRREAE